MNGSRGKDALNDRQIEMCREIWEVLGGDHICELDFSDAMKHGSQTRFNQAKNRVFVGADVMPGRLMVDARSRMSPMACLAHELAHAERYNKYGFDRPLEMPDKLRDEAEASLLASWNPSLNKNDKSCLVEDDRDQLITWLAMQLRTNYED
jgi:hypothetical protein